MESVLNAAGISMRKERRSRAVILQEVERMMGVSRDDIFRHSHERGPAYARAVYCCLCAEESGATGSELARELGVSPSAVSKLVVKGRRLIRQRS